MSTIRSLVFALMFATTCTSAFANIAAIHRDKLPQTTTVLAAYDDARELEPYTDHWSGQWSYPVSKTEAVSRLGKDLGFLQAATKDHPNNPELLLLTALVAHYGYNVDLDGSHDIVLARLKDAEALLPGDVRPHWFHADFICQTNKAELGGTEFMSIEAANPWENLPPAFWDDYAACATVTNMPAHVLRALDYLKKIKAGTTEMRTFYAETSSKRFDAFDPSKKYEPKEAFYANEKSGVIEFTSSVCGIRFQAQPKWKVEDIELTNGSCIANFSSGPYKATKGTLSPEILLIVRRPAEDETIADFAQHFVKKAEYETSSIEHCPASICLGFKLNQPDMYAKNGGGKARITTFERNQPNFSGLIFETPSSISSPGQDGINVYHPNQTLGRIPGKLYYVVLLDTAASIEQDALKDYQFFLEHILVE